MASLLINKLSNKDVEKIEFLKTYAKSQARTKVILFCLDKTYNFYHDAQNLTKTD